MYPWDGDMATQFVWSRSLQQEAPWYGEHYGTDNANALVYLCRVFMRPYLLSVVCR